MKFQRPRAALLILLAITVVYGSVATWRRMSRPPGRWVGYTECAWRGKPRVVVRPGLIPLESRGVVAHESVHAAQCDSLGPVRYRWQTIFAGSNLALETPAYCASGHVRARLRDTAFARTTIAIDMNAAMGDGVDSAEIQRSLREVCPAFSLAK